MSTPPRTHFITISSLCDKAKKAGRLGTRLVWFCNTTQCHIIGTVDLVHMQSTIILSAKPISSARESRPRHSYNEVNNKLQLIAGRYPNHQKGIICHDLLTLYKVTIEKGILKAYQHSWPKKGHLP